MQLPTVVLSQVATADGRLALSPNVLLMGDSRWPQYPDSGYAGVLERHRPGALLEGSGSLALPDAGTIDPAGLDLDQVAAPDGEHFLPQEVLARTIRWYTVVDSRGRVRWQFKEFDDHGWAGTHLLVLVSRATPAHYLAFLRAERIPYLVAGAGRVDLREALAIMRAELRVEIVVATCGAHLGGALLRAGLIDQLEIEVLPVVAGGYETPVMLSAPDLAPEELPTHLRLLDARPRPDGRVLLRYEIGAGDSFGRK